jgi:hypothetical protein
MFLGHIVVDPDAVKELVATASLKVSPPRDFEMAVFRPRDIKLRRVNIGADRKLLG